MAEHLRTGLNLLATAPRCPVGKCAGSVFRIALRFSVTGLHPRDTIPPMQLMTPLLVTLTLAVSPACKPWHDHKSPAGDSPPAMSTSLTEGVADASDPTQLCHAKPIHHCECDKLIESMADSRCYLHELEEGDHTKSVRDLAKNLVLLVPEPRTDAGTTFQDKESSDGKLCPDNYWFNHEPTWAREYTCSGAIISGKRILTAWHCLGSVGIAAAVTGFTKEDPNVKMFKLDLESREVERIGKDIVVIPCPTCPDSSLEIAIELPKQGDRVFALGHPVGLPAIYAGHGHIAKVEHSLAPVTFDADHGMSGSPIFNRTLELVGVMAETRGIVNHPACSCRGPIVCTLTSTSHCGTKSQLVTRKKIDP